MAETTVLKSSASPRNASPSMNGGSAYTQLSATLPMVNVTMTQGQAVQGNQPNKNVVVMPRRGAGGAGPRAAPGVLPMVQVNMTQGTARNASRNAPAPARPQLEQSISIAPEFPLLSSDQLMLCRHLAVQYLEQQEPGSENATLAASTIAAIDQSLTSAAATAAAQQAAPGVRKVIVSSPRSQVGATAAPRRVPSRVPGNGGPSRIVTAQAQAPVIDVPEATEAPDIEPRDVIDLPDVTDAE
jgi:hypothetical protein